MLVALNKPAARIYFQPLRSPNLPSPLLLRALLLNQGPFPPPALPGFCGNMGLSDFPPSPTLPSREAGWASPLGVRTGRDLPCCYRTPLANMLSSMPRWTRTGYYSRSRTCPMAAFPYLGGVGIHIRWFRGLLEFIRITACWLADPLSGLLHQGLRTFHRFHARLGCYRLERKVPGGVFSHWSSAPFHGARRVGSRREGVCPSTPSSFPDSPSSHRTCEFAASGARTKRHAFAHGRLRVRTDRWISPSSSRRYWSGYWDTPMPCTLCFLHSHRRSRWIAYRSIA